MDQNMVIYTWASLVAKNIGNLGDPPHVAFRAASSKISCKSGRLSFTIYEGPEVINKATVIGGEIDLVDWGTWLTSVLIKDPSNRNRVLGMIPVVSKGRVHWDLFIKMLCIELPVFIDLLQNVLTPDYEVVLTYNTQTYSDGFGSQVFVVLNKDPPKEILYNIEDLLKHKDCNLQNMRGRRFLTTLEELRSDEFIDDQSDPLFAHKILEWREGASRHFKTTWFKYGKCHPTFMGQIEKYRGVRKNGFESERGDIMSYICDARTGPEPFRTEPREPLFQKGGYVRSYYTRPTYKNFRRVQHPGQVEHMRTRSGKVSTVEGGNNRTDDGWEDDTWEKETPIEEKYVENINIEEESEEQICDGFESILLSSSGPQTESSYKCGRLRRNAPAYSLEKKLMEMVRKVNNNAQSKSDNSSEIEVGDSGWE